MSVYLIMLFLVVIFSLLAIKYYTVATNSKNNLGLIKTKQPNKFFVWLVFLCIAFVAMFRYNVGTDFFGYYDSARLINRFNKGNYRDPGFTIFSIICYYLFGGVDGSITMGAAFVTVAIFVFKIAKNSENFSFSIILFVLIGVFAGLFNGVRQYLATAILFAGYDLIVERKPIKWLLLVLLASTFHITAILMFFVYFICKPKCSWWLVFLYSIIAVILLFAYEPLFDLVGALKQDEIDANNAYMNSSVDRLRVLVQCVPVIFLFFLDKEKVNSDKEARFLLNVCLLNAAIAIAAMNSPYFSRFWIYTNCFQILMFPKIFNKMKTNDRRIFIALLLIGYSIFWFYEISKSTILSNYTWIFKYLK